MSLQIRLNFVPQKGQSPLHLTSQGWIVRRICSHVAPKVFLRLDPGEGRIRTAREFTAWEGGGEYNISRGLRKCFGLQDRRLHRVRATTRSAI